MNNDVTYITAELESIKEELINVIASYQNPITIVINIINNVSNSAIIQGDNFGIICAESYGSININNK